MAEDLSEATPPTDTTPAERAGRRNKRSEVTIKTILVATEQILLLSGADRISILDVCKVAHVARGTFYRYFSSQEDLLEAFSRHKRDLFHQALTNATAPFDDPDERFEALIVYLDDYLGHSGARRLLVVAPNYAMEWFGRIFVDSIHRFQEVLRIVFDAWEIRYGISIDRELICELLIRYVLSEVLISGGIKRRDVPDRIGRMVAALIAASSPRRRS